jgi:hypothetical protein
MRRVIEGEEEPEECRQLTEAASRYITPGWVGYWEGLRHLEDVGGELVNLLDVALTRQRTARDAGRANRGKLIEACPYPLGSAERWWWLEGWSQEKGGGST